MHFVNFLSFSKHASIQVYLFFIRASLKLSKSCCFCVDCPFKFPHKKNMFFSSCASNPNQCILTKKCSQSLTMRITIFFISSFPRLLSVRGSDHSVFVSPALGNLSPRPRRINTLITRADADQA